MKASKYTFLIVLLSLISCGTQRNYEKEFLPSFFKEQPIKIAICSMLDKKDINNIMIYDINSSINQKNLNAKYIIDSINITITKDKPFNEQYIILAECIVNKDLAVVTLKTFTSEEYKRFYLKRIAKHKKWFLLNISEGGTR